MSSRDEQWRRLTRRVMDCRMRVSTEMTSLLRNAVSDTYRWQQQCVWVNPELDYMAQRAAMADLHVLRTTNATTDVS